MLGDILKVEFELSENDFVFFKECLDKVCDNCVDDEQMIIEGIVVMKKEVIVVNLLKFVIDCLEKFDLLVNMVWDEDWKLFGEDCKCVFDVFVYFVDLDDLIFDCIFGIGYIDDVIMIDLVSVGFVLELDVYVDFVVYCEDFVEEGGEDKLMFEEVCKVMQLCMYCWCKCLCLLIGGFGGGLGFVICYFQVLDYFELGLVGFQIFVNFVCSLLNMLFIFDQCQVYIFFFVFIKINVWCDGDVGVFY